MYQLIKRIFDVLFSLIGLLLLSPLFVLISIILKLTGEGEIFYLQKRVGFNCDFFPIYKFATMLKDSPNMAGGFATVRNDPRVTKFGSILRATKLNELPQLLNVIKGDMSLVGPRPLVPKSFSNYPPEIRKKIYSIRPGLTGIGSVIFRDEEKLITNANNKGLDTKDYYKDVILPYKGKLEIWYINNQSFYTDIAILILTGLIVFVPSVNLSEKFFPNLPKQ